MKIYLSSEIQDRNEIFNSVTGVMKLKNYYFSLLSSFFVATKKAAIESS